MSIVKKYIKKISRTQQELKQYLINEINKININIGVKKINNLCSTISFSTISKNNYILSTSYYNIETQKDIVIKNIQNSKDSGIKYIETIIKTNYDAKTSLKFHPEFIKELQQIIEK